MPGRWVADINRIEDVVMADNGGGNSFLGFILGALVVVVALMGYLMYSGVLPGQNTSTVKLEIPKAQTK